MRNIYYIIAAALLLTSCAEEINSPIEEPKNGLRPVIARAYLPGEDEAITKVVLDESSDADGNPIVNVGWTVSGEAFSVMTSSSVGSQTFSQISGSEFSGNLETSWTAPYYAFYPVSSAANAASVPYDLSSQEGTLTSGSPYMYAVSDDGENYTFRHMTALLKLKLIPPEAFAGVNGIPTAVRIESDRLVTVGNADLTGETPVMTGTGVNFIDLPGMVAGQSSYTVYVYVNPMEASSDNPNTITVSMPSLNTSATAFKGAVVTSKAIEAGKLYTASVSLGGGQKLSSPSNVAVNGGVLSWTDASSYESGYDIYMIKDAGQVGLVTSLPAGTTNYTLPALEPGIYTFGVQATAASASTYSDSDIVYSGEYTVKGKCDAPSELLVEQYDATSIKLSWKDNCLFEDGYIVWKGDNTAEVASDVTEYIFKGLSSGETWNFGVQTKGAVSADNSSIVFAGDYTVMDWATLQSYDADKDAPEGVYRECSVPVILSWIQNTGTSATLTWSCWSSAEVGFNLYVRKASETEWTAAHLKETIEENSTSYTFEGLSAGDSYVFGVQTKGSTDVRNSDIVETAAKEMAIMNSVSVTVDNVTSTYAYVAVDYTISGLPAGEECAERGLWISTTSDVPGSAGSDGVKLKGPNADGRSVVKQLIPCARLATGISYFMRAYAWDSTAGSYVYSDSQEISLTSQPSAITLSWSKVSASSVPSSISIYKTTSALNGRNFNAWYAIADPTEVDFRVLYENSYGAVATLAEQATSDCYVLINGAIFGNYNIGAIITGGSMTQTWHGEIEGCYWGTNDELYQLTRAMIGVDADGKAGAYWVNMPKYNTFYFYNYPMTTVVGQAKYSAPSASYPYPAVDWSPEYAISCGPMLLYNGKVCVNHAKTGGYYMTNYECWNESGIYYGNPDRTAIGVTADGKIILFVCDGRITASEGAYLTELAQVMKGLGCVHAMNLDGGGSTGMWVKGNGYLNYQGHGVRSVKSTCGFFAK